MWILKNSKELLDNLKSPKFNLITNIKSFYFSTLYTTNPHQKLKIRLVTIIRNSFIYKKMKSTFLMMTIYSDTLHWSGMTPIFSPLPACRGTLSLLAVCPSVCLSVSQSVTLQLSRLFSAVFWDINFKYGIHVLIGSDIKQIKFEFRHGWPNLYRSYCPLLKFTFPEFSLQSFEKLTWLLVYEFVMTLYRSSSRFVMFDLLLQELLPFAKI